MDEMNNMNEVTTEETSNEVTPVVTENNEVKTEANSGINLLVVVGGAAAAVVTIAYGTKKLLKRKGEKKVEKEKKPKKHIEFCKPWRIVKDEPEENKDVESENDPEEEKKD